MSAMRDDTRHTPIIDAGDIKDIIFDTMLRQR